MLICTNFDSFAITYNKWIASIISFQRLCLILCKHKRTWNQSLGRSFCRMFLMKLFLLEHYINWANFITSLCLLPKLFSKMYFLIQAQAFDDVMKSENLKFSNLIFSRTKRAFEVKQKTLFLVSQVLSFRIKKQSSKNLADTTFKYMEFCHGLQFYREKVHAHYSIRSLTTILLIKSE